MLQNNVLPYRRFCKFCVGNTSNKRQKRRILHQHYRKNSKLKFRNKYFLEKCVSTKLENTIFHDDDMFCDPQKLKEISKVKNDNLKCLNNLFEYERAHRFGRYKLSISNWPAGFYLPTFCTGWACENFLKKIKAIQKMSNK